MTERPILFNDEMVRAILDGRKTQHRVPTKPQPIRIEDGMFGERWIWGDHGGTPEMLAILMEEHSPFGQPGDWLWVREAWAVGCAYDSYPPRVLTPAGQGNNIAYKAGGGFSFEFNERGRWRLSIHMPRWASRITLEITNVRVEQVQDISSADIEAEGIVLAWPLEWCDEKTLPPPRIKGALNGPQGRSAEGVVACCHANNMIMFTYKWDSIYAKKGLGAADNPWVFAVTFRRIK